VISYRQALIVAEDYVRDHRPEARVNGVLEDAEDYFVQLRLAPGHTEWIMGPGPIFISKATGTVWSDAYGNVLDKIDGMREVRADRFLAKPEDVRWLGPAQ
jgi:hypothetical protein